MKKVNHHKNRKVIPLRRSYRYPNAAERSYYLNKLSDIVLTVAVTCGTATILLFLFTLA